MDLKNLTPQRETHVTKIKDPRAVDEKGNPVPEGAILEHDGHEFWVERYLPHTEEYKKAQYKRTQKYLKAAQAKGKDSSDIDLYEAEKDRIEVMAETTVAWQLYFGGEWLEFTPEKAKEIYEEAFWIVEDLQEGENSADVFTKG